MKKLFFALIVLVLAACSNTTSETNEVADSAINNNSAVDNVNGNIPDTTNSISIDGGNTEPAPKDTTRK